MPKLSSSQILAIMNAVSEKSVSSHDIIPRSELPSFSLYQLTKIIEHFGAHATHAYWEHIQYTNKIKNIILEMIRRRIQTGQTCQLAMTMYAMGIGECQALATILHNELLKSDFSDFHLVCILNPNTIKGHCFLVIGNHRLNIHDDFQTALSHCSEEVLIADPYLSYLGSARDYVASNQNYFSQFDYQTIVSLTKANPMHLENILQTERLSFEWVKEIKQEHQIERFYDKKLIPLAKTGYPCIGKSYTHETALLQQLKKSGLAFFGLSRNYKVDAVCEVTNRIDELKVKSIKTKINAGVYYHNAQGQTFFVVPEINYDSRLANAITRL